MRSQNQWRNENLFDNREEGLEHGLHVSLQCLPVVYTADTSVVWN